MMEAPVVLFSAMPPDAGVGAESLITMEFCKLVSITMFCSGGIVGGAVAAVGTSDACDQNPPTQIGLSGSPSSYSTQTEAVRGGTAKKPSEMPATGTQGRAQLEGVTPVTAGTITWIRPRCSGSILLTTTPRYLPQYWLMPAPPELSRPSRCASARMFVCIRRA